MRVPEGHDTPQHKLGPKLFCHQDVKHDVDVVIVVLDGNEGK